MMQCSITGAIPLQAVHHSKVPVRTALDGLSLKAVIHAFNDSARCRIAHSFGETERANLFKTNLSSHACAEEKHEVGSDRTRALAVQTRQPSCCLTGATMPPSVFGLVYHPAHANSRGHLRE